MAGEAGPTAVASQPRLVARVGERSVVLHWDPLPGGPTQGYRVSRSVGDAPVAPLGPEPIRQTSFVDLTVTNGQTYRYVVRVEGNEAGEAQALTAHVTPRPFANDDAFLELLQATAFDYFWYEANPDNGLVRDRSTTNSFCSIAAVGFGLTAMGIGIDHGWITREQGRTRVLTTLKTFWEGPQGDAVAGTIGHRGWFYHFLDMQTAHRFNAQIELSSIDTALFLAGVLDAREYFDGADPEERRIRDLADALIGRVDWNWMRNGGDTLTMGWLPGRGFLESRWRGYNEASLLYIFGLGAPDNPLPAAAWPAWTKDYRWATHHGQSFVVFPPLFGHQYTQCWIDLRAVADAYMQAKGITYFENSRRATLAQRAYAVANPGRFRGYGADCWGLTACDGPKGYAARGAPPAENDDGTIAPTAAGGSFCFTPVESLAALRSIYNTHRERLWSPYGFRDAFNLQADWWGPDVLGIDQGPILLMIENQRTERVWRRMQRSAVVQRGLARAGFTPVKQAAAAKPSATIECLTPKVGKYERVEFRLRLLNDPAHPFDSDETQADVRVVTPTGRRLWVPAFQRQDYERQRVGAEGAPRDWLYPVGLPGWAARFASEETGRHEATLVVKDARGATESGPVEFEVSPSARRGFVRVSAHDPRFLETSDGEPFFAIGQNLAFIGSGQYVTLSKAEGIFGQLAENGANYLRVWTCCEDWALAIEARKSAWGRSWDWRPPIAPMPDAESPSKRCLHLTSDRRTIEANPSHPVALRPGTRYRLTGQVRIARPATVRLELQRAEPATLSAPASGSPWLPFAQEFVTAANEFWLAPVRFRLAGEGPAWLADVSLREAAGGPELLWEADVNRAVRGWYNPVDCFLLDELVQAAERHGIRLQLCLLTRDLYMDALKDPASADYDRAIADARKLLRYAVGRWGYSTSVAAWEYWNEMNPGLPTDRFYTALGEYLDGIDPYQHLRTTSTWGPSEKDGRHPKLDLADTHFYLRPSDKARLPDEVEAVLDRTTWLRERAPRKPAHLGEFGLADEKWRITDELKASPELADFHNALWASALSGASGTVLPWWWERLDQKNVYPGYRPLAEFVKDVPWTRGELKPTASVTADDRVRVVALQSADRAWVWLFNRDAAWARLALEHRSPTAITNASLAVAGLSPGVYRVQWWNPRAGGVTSEDRSDAPDGTVRATAPPFTHDLAVRVLR